VEFLSEHGDLPLLQADMSGIQSIDPILAAYVGDDLMEITEYQKGEGVGSLSGDWFCVLNEVQCCCWLRCVLSGAVLC
jgi:hypothetical protein